jgi:hypothetical protein
MTVARTSQVVAEVVRLNTANNIRLSQVVLEVVRPNAPDAPPNTQRPVVIICT